MNSSATSPDAQTATSVELAGEFVHRRSDFVATQLGLIRRLPGVSGTLLATVDGRTLLSDIVETTPGSTAAVTASSLALAARLGDLTAEGAAVEELQVRSKAGYVCLYVVDENMVLTVVATHSVNLALLKLETRSVINDLRRELKTHLSTGQSTRE